MDQLNALLAQIVFKGNQALPSRWTPTTSLTKQGYSGVVTTADQRKWRLMRILKYLPVAFDLSDHFLLVFTVKRNSRGKDRLFVREGHPACDFFVGLYEGGETKEVSKGFLDWYQRRWLVYTYDASTSISHVGTGTTEAQPQEKGARTLPNRRETI